jgi:hypothetical protein
MKVKRTNIPVSDLGGWAWTRTLNAIKKSKTNLTPSILFYHSATFTHPDLRMIVMMISDDNIDNDG